MCEHVCTSVQKSHIVGSKHEVDFSIMIMQVSLVNEQILLRVSVLYSLCSCGGFLVSFDVLMKILFKGVNCLCSLFMLSLFIFQIYGEYCYVKDLISANYLTIYLFKFI